MPVFTAWRINAPIAPPAAIDMIAYIFCLLPQKTVTLFGFEVQAKLMAQTNTILKGIALSITAFAFFSAGDVTVKLLSENYTTLQTVFYLTASGIPVLLLASPWLGGLRKSIFTGVWIAALPSPCAASQLRRDKLVARDDGSFFSVIANPQSG
jgi:hypothetical protein